MRKKNKEVTSESDFANSLLTTCQFCDDAGYGFDTEEQYKSHLVTRHGVKKNLDKLLQLSVDINSGNGVTKGDYKEVKKEPVSNPVRRRETREPAEQRKPYPRDKVDRKAEDTNKRVSDHPPAVAPPQSPPPPPAASPAAQEQSPPEVSGGGKKYSEIVKNLRTGGGQPAQRPTTASPGGPSQETTTIDIPFLKTNKKEGKKVRTESSSEGKSTIVANHSDGKMSVEVKKNAKVANSEVIEANNGQLKKEKPKTGQDQKNPVSAKDDVEKSKSSKTDATDQVKKEKDQKTADVNNKPQEEPSTINPDDANNKKKQKQPKKETKPKEKKLDELDELVRKINAKPKPSKKQKEGDKVGEKSGETSGEAAKAKERKIEDRMADIDEGGSSASKPVITKDKSKSNKSGHESAVKADQKDDDKKTKNKAKEMMSFDDFQLPSAKDINLCATEGKPDPLSKSTPAPKLIDQKSVPTKKEAKPSVKDLKAENKAKAKAKEEPAAKVNEILPKIDDGPASGILPKTDLDEVNDILDEWFKGEGGDDDDDEDIPDELPDVDDDLNLFNSKAPTAKSRIEEYVEEPDVKVTAAADATEEESKEESVPCGDCTVCGRLAKAACSVCKHVWYCTREHQRKDWNSHKDSCKELVKLPYRVERSPIFGRFLVAMKDIEEGELILQDSPMVVGPRQLTKPVCLGCHKEISFNQSIKCIRCNWPVCSKKCQDSETHLPECRATQAAGARIKVEVFGQTNMMYACITILRALSLQEGPKKIWEDYTKFDSHLEERIKTPVYNKVNKEKVVFFILHYLNIKKYSDLEILEACGKLDTNCFEIRQNGLNLRGMYRTACLMSHDCRPNTRHTFAPDHTINIYATTRIKKGEVISATYTNSLWSTQDRREHLKMSKCFWCECKRCRDPTEFKSFLSAIRCSRCKGFSDDIQSDDLQYLLSTNPLDKEAHWRCTKCTNIQKGSQIQAGNLSISNQLKTTNKSSIDSLISFLKQYEPVLGPTNHHIIEVKYTIVSLLGNSAQYPLENLTMEMLLVKEKFCRDLLDLADRIEPGCSRWRGTILLELQMAVVALAAGQAESEMISKGQAKEKADEALDILRRATNILMIEPDMISVLEERMKSVTYLLNKWQD